MNTTKRKVIVFRNSNYNWKQPKKPATTMEIDVEDHITASFARLPEIETNNDLAGFKSLLSLIAQWLIVTAKYREATDLRVKIFALAFAKLPADKQEYYDHLVNSGNRGEEQSLLDLRKFVQDEIILYSRLVNSGQLLAGSKSPSAAKKGNVMSGTRQSGPQCCNYCRLPGHIKRDCVERNATFCMKCLTWGHNRNYCQAPIKEVQLEDIAV